MKNSNIEWCDHTFNAWEGCTMISPGCANCYAENRNQRFHGGKHWGPGAPRLIRSDAYWKEPLKWDKEAAKRQDELTARRKAIGAKDGPEWHARRPRVFCSSLADWLDEEGPIDQLARLMTLIHATPNSDWLLLTKRPQNWKRRIPEAIRSITTLDGKNGDVWQWMVDWFGGLAPANVWIGTTVEDQQRADERIPELLKIPARVRFLSCEPLLGPVNLVGRAWTGQHGRAAQQWEDGARSIDWVICGGESGPKARPMHPDWAGSLRDQCQSAGVPFLFKQWGEWMPGGFYDGFTVPDCMGDRANDEKNMHYFNSAPFGKSWRVGKNRSGRMLDGREWNGFPVTP